MFSALFSTTSMCTVCLNPLQYTASKFDTWITVFRLRMIKLTLQDNSWSLITTDEAQHKHTGLICTSQTDVFFFPEPYLCITSKALS